MLAGYTTAIIGFPAVTAPDTIFDVAVSRVEEILLGILCASVTHSLIFPRRLTGVLAGRIEYILSDASAWIREALNGRRSIEMDREGRRLALHATELHLLSTHLPFDTAPAPLIIGAVHALQDRLSVLLPLATAAEDRLEALETYGHPLEPDLQRLIGEVREFTDADAMTSGEQAERLVRTCLTLEPAIDAASDWPTLLKATLLKGLGELIRRLVWTRWYGLSLDAPCTSTLAWRCFPPQHAHWPSSYVARLGSAPLGRKARWPPCGPQSVARYSPRRTTRRRRSSTS
jgi:uncharacterized membrane protein YccC